MPQPDPRCTVGGFCWAKATSVSNDSHRIYGVEAPKIWLRGTVLEVLSVRSEGAQRASTLIKAQYKVGNVERVKILNLMQLKKENPVPDPVPPVTTPPDAGSLPAGSVPNEGVNPSSAAAPIQHPPVEGTVESQATATSNGSSVCVPVVTVHDREWFTGDTELPTNGPFTRRTWKLTCQYTGREFTPGCDQGKELNACDYFLAVFPKAQLKLMVEETSILLSASGYPRTTKGEILKWFGILLLITRFEFGDRRDLWARKSSSKYIPAANLGECTGMIHDRFELMLRLMVWSKQLDTRPEGMSHEAYRWLLIEDFVSNFNEHCQQFFSPSWHMCADESISRWYGLGGHWINMGLPMYVAMDRKPEDGLEIQNSCCAISGIMCQLKLVKTAAANAE